MKTLVAEIKAILVPSAIGAGITIAAILIIFLITIGAIRID